ncbi:MAG TPA: hypothetical protein VGH80_12405 [Xanthomonadaceae bacterium]
MIHPLLRITLASSSSRVGSSVIRGCLTVAAITAFFSGWFGVFHIENGQFAAGRTKTMNV